MSQTYERLRYLMTRIFPKASRERLCELEASLAARWAASAHQRLHQVQWGMSPQPEFFDHAIDLYQHWGASRNALWVERGVFGSLALQGGLVLELCCGDGFNAKHFYSLRSQHITACDFDPQAIALAERKNVAPNVQYVVCDIRMDMPLGLYHNIIWDGAIEHFTPGEITQILKTITTRLRPNGILSGYTIVERAEGKSLHHHEYEFKSKEDLAEVLKPHFRNVTVFETIYPDRHNLYWWASNGPVPFSADWPHVVRVIANE